MDISFKTAEGKFNYRVCAVMVHSEKLLAMHDERSPYFYLPGGRVKMGETAEQALVREVREELSVTPEILRPLWLNQGFFTEDVDGMRYHEICIYFLTDVSRTDLMARGQRFSLHEGARTNVFEWLDFNRLKDEYFYPTFLKTAIFDLPETFALRTETE